PFCAVVCHILFWAPKFIERRLLQKSSAEIRRFPLPVIPPSLYKAATRLKCQRCRFHRSKLLVSVLRRRNSDYSRSPLRPVLQQRYGQREALRSHFDAFDGDEIVPRI